jgi:hypothetical protein
VDNQMNLSRWAIPLVFSIGFSSSALSMAEPSENIHFKNGLEAYQEKNYTKALVELELAHDQRVREGSVTLSYLYLHDLPNRSANVDVSRYILNDAVRDESFNSIIYVTYFYQKTRTPEAAYMVGLTYFLHPNSEQFSIGDEPAWAYWFRKSQEDGYNGSAY